MQFSGVISSLNGIASIPVNSVSTADLSQKDNVNSDKLAIEH